MSIPTRFDVYFKDKETLKNQSLFTFSYGSSLHDRNLWIKEFKESISVCLDVLYSGVLKWNITEEKHGWMRDFENIHVPLYDHWFKREELI